MTQGDVERVEVRDGKEYRVTVIPEKTRPRRAKGMRTKKYARAQAVARQIGAGPRRSGGS